MFDAKEQQKPDDKHTVIILSRPDQSANVPKANRPKEAQRKCRYAKLRAPLLK